MIPLHALRRRLLVQYLLTVGLLLAGAEGLIYGLSRWAGEQQLDTLLRQDVRRVAAALELTSYEIKIDGKRTLERIQAANPTVDWQVCLEDKSTVIRSPSRYRPDLPAVGGTELPLERIVAADAYLEDKEAVRAARLRTVRERVAKPPPPKLKAMGWPWPSLMPAQMIFDVRAVTSRKGLDERLAQLVIYLAAVYVVSMVLAAWGGVFLIRRALRPVEAAFQRERQFTGAVSHELRTPLTALRGEIELALRRARTPEEYAALLERLQPLVTRMNELVEGLLVLARGRGGHLLLGAGELSGEAVCRAAEEGIQHLPGRERVELSCAGLAEQRIMGDGLLLGLALRNLVENALRHAPENPVRLSIQPAPAGGLQITVDDQGPGLADGVLVDVATPANAVNQQLHAGLGLTIAGAIVKAHGGTLTLSNRPEGGCRAEMVLPRS